MECRNVLVETAGDLDKASKILEERGLAKAQKKAARVASQGLVEAYIHPGGRLGVLVELNCETDFVAHTDEFKGLAHNLALQIAATAPQFISAEQIPQEMKLDPKEVCLLAQPFIKDQTKSIETIINEVVAKVGEKISIGRFVRFQVGK